MSSRDAEGVAAVEKALQEWRQGDATLNAGLFLVHVADKRLPLTKVARDSAEGVGEEVIFEVLSSVDGLVVVTQTCNIVKKCSHHEYVEVSPLVFVEDGNQFYEIKKGRRSSYTYLPGLADQKLVVDLDRTMTVEKAVVANWSRIPGCRTDDERIAFAEALARKRRRFAFPAAFNVGLVKFRNHIKKQDRKTTAEGRLVAALHEIRVQATPSWHAPDVTVFFWFLLERQNNIDFEESCKVVEKWMGLVQLSDGFKLATPSFALVEQRDMTVEDYLMSPPLDYDDLSL